MNWFKKLNIIKLQSISTVHSTSLLLYSTTHCLQVSVNGALDNGLFRPLVPIGRRFFLIHGPLDWTLWPWPCWWSLTLRWDWIALKRLHWPWALCLAFEGLLLRPFGLDWLRKNGLFQPVAVGIVSWSFSGNLDEETTLSITV